MNIKYVFPNNTPSNVVLLLEEFRALKQTMLAFAEKAAATKKTWPEAATAGKALMDSFYQILGKSHMAKLLEVDTVYMTEEEHDELTHFLKMYGKLNAYFTYATQVGGFIPISFEIVHRELSGIPFGHGISFGRKG